MMAKDRLESKYVTVSPGVELHYWEKGEAYFDLKISNLSEGKYAVVDEAGILYAKSENEPYWTAAELAKDGVRLEVGSVRTRVFEIRQEGPSALEGITARLTSAEMTKAYSLRRATLAEEAARDAIEEKARRAAGRHPPET